MGIAKFYRYIAERYPLINQQVITDGTMMPEFGPCDVAAGRGPGGAGEWRGRGREPASRPRRPCEELPRRPAASSPRRCAVARLAAPHPPALPGMAALPRQTTCTLT